MNTIFLLILIFLLFGFFSDLILDWLNLRNIQPELPAILQGKYDSDRYRTSQSYLKVHSRFNILVSVISFGAVFLMIFSGGFAWLNEQIFSITSQPVIAGLLFLGILGLVADLAATPFEIYSTFVIEKEFGFNKTTPATFIKDKIKTWLLAILIGAPLIALIIWIYTLTGAWFWLIAWIIISGFSILMSFFYSTLIVPIFSKQVPLAEGELRTAIEVMSRNAGFELSMIYVINGSKRSTRSNAYFAGFGSKHRIVLYDTLLNDLTTSQILSVLAHEAGHYKKKHIIYTMVLSVVQTGILLYFFSLFAGNPALANALNIAQSSFHISILVFGILYSPISMLTGLLLNYLSRKFEYQADDFAANLGYKIQLADALTRLSEKNLGNLTPHPAYVAAHYSHPTLLQRLEHLLK